MLLLLLLGTAHARTESVREIRTAEAIRLRNELERLAERNLWAGVEHAYELLAATGVPLELEDHRLGAEAAMTVGDVGAARERLLRGLALVDDPQLDQWLIDIDARFVPVEIDEAHAIEPLRTSTRPDEIVAWRYARDRLARDGRFHGLLPCGAYSVDGRTFVLAGPATFADRE